MLGALGAAMGQFSPLLGRVFPGHAVSPSSVAPLFWVFCLSPIEPVGSEQWLGRSCSEAVLLGVVAAGSQAVDEPISLCAWVARLASLLLSAWVERPLGPPLWACVWSR